MSTAVTSHVDAEAEEELADDDEADIEDIIWSKSSSACSSDCSCKSNLRGSSVWVPLGFLEGFRSPKPPGYIPEVLRNPKNPSEAPRMPLSSPKDPLRTAWGSN